jgi:hypothetical protein
MYFNFIAEGNIDMKNYFKFGLIYFLVFLAGEKIFKSVTTQRMQTQTFFKTNNYSLNLANKSNL